MFEFGIFIQMLPAVALFITQHWDSIVAVCTAFVLLFQSMKAKQYEKLWPAVVEMVRGIANEELSGPEKRKEVAKSTMQMIPLWMKTFVTETEVEKLAEQAYQYSRGELKAEQSNK